MTAILVSILVGIVSWSLAEYCIHRWFGHVHPKNPFGREHMAHHSRGGYFGPNWKKAATAFVATVLLLIPGLLLLPQRLVLGFVGGFIFFYLFYEILHRFEHVWSGIGPYGRWARQHHLYHHFHDPSRNFGVTSPIWDLTFGTYVRASVVSVPEKLQMRWLCDPKTGEVRPHLQRYYRLRQRNVVATTSARLRIGAT